MANINLVSEYSTTKYTLLFKYFYLPYIFGSDVSKYFQYFLQDTMRFRKGLYSNCTVVLLLINKFINLMTHHTVFSMQDNMFYDARNAVLSFSDTVSSDLIQ